ncbi:sigma 54-interacting transcriptional regulator [Hydrogenibacillus sp. N12]|nr:sigma 54-interacting transcriptional regulator [Hydrogenibacillus sp. N12]
MKLMERGLSLQEPVILDALPIGILIVDVEGKILFQNRTAVAWGMLVEHLVRQMDWMKIIQEDMLVREQVHVNERWYAFQAMSIGLKERSQEGINAIGMMVIEEITEYQKLKKELDEYRTSFQDLQTIFDNSYDVIYVSDGSGITMRVSSACERLWGMKKEELVGRSVFELEAEGVFRPSVTRLVLETGRKVQVLQETMTGRRLMVVGTPIKDASGRIVRVVNASRDVTEIEELERELHQLKSIVEGYRRQIVKLQERREAHGERLVYRSKAMEKLVALIERVAATDSTVLILGESGVGKEIIVNYIHRLSSRANKPLIKINCAAIPDSLLESELFGYEPGAFTGADKHGKAGLFELSHEGTLFLDEIGDMPIGLQAKLLRVLQEKEVVRIGGHKPIRVDVRIIAATNQDLQYLVEKGKFRQDLYYRLNVIPIIVPPLRERREDIIPLIHHFLNLYQSKIGRSITLAKETLELLEAYDWPGNVRELQNIVERLVVTAESEVVTVDQLPAGLKQRTSSRSKQERQGEGAAEDKDGVDVKRIIPLRDAVRTVEMKLIRMALKEYGTISNAAKELKVDQSTLSRKIQKLNMR